MRLLKLLAFSWGCLGSRFPSQISFFADLNFSLVPNWAELVAVCASRSKGSRKVATTSPSSQVQFDSTKLSRRRFSRGSELFEMYGSNFRHRGPAYRIREPFNNDDGRCEPRRLRARSSIAASEAGQMAASDYVPIFFKNRLHLAGRPQMSTQPKSKRTWQPL